MPSRPKKSDLEKMEAEINKLRRHQTLYDAIERLGHIGHYEWNLDLGRLESCSEEYARIFNMSLDEVLESQDSRAKKLGQIHPDDREEYEKTTEILQKSKSLDVQFRIIRNDGSIRHIHELGVLIVDEAGNIKGNFGILQDITEKKEAENSLQESRDSLETIVEDRTQKLAETINKLKQEITEREQISSELEIKNAELERFAYTVSHDLKTPLFTIKIFLGLLSKNILANNMDRVTGDIEKLNSAADTMDNLLNDLLELSRVGRVMGNPVICNLSNIAQQAARLAEAKVEELGVEIVIEDMAEVKADETRLVEVYLNLIENAIKFMGEQNSPRVHIGAVEKDDMISCFVRDNGVGIDAEYNDRIFELFERLNIKVEGTGIGLALVKRIIEVNGGKIWVESEGLGHGSTMWFTLPKALS
jgi:PAS domain S-box-containing protein